LHENEPMNDVENLRRLSLTLYAQIFKISTFSFPSLPSEKKPILPSPFPSPTLPSEGRCPAMP